MNTAEEDTLLKMHSWEEKKEETWENGHLFLNKK